MKLNTIILNVTVNHVHGKYIWIIVSLLYDCRSYYFTKDSVIGLSNR